MEALTLNERAVIGGNNPPEPTPFDLAKAAVEDAWLEAKNWLDGAKVSSQAEADAIARLLDMARKAEAKAEAARKAEVKPFDDAKADVQARYAPLIADTKTATGKTVMIVAACKAAMAPWLQKLADQQRAELATARAEAQRLADIAAEAARAAPADDLAARETADAAEKDARQAASVAAQAAKARPQAIGGSRATTLRTTWKAEIIDLEAALLHYLATNPDGFASVIQKLADDDVSAGKRSVPGVRVYSVESVV